MIYAFLMIFAAGLIFLKYAVYLLRPGAWTYEPRTPVPWNGWDVFGLFLLCNFIILATTICVVSLKPSRFLSEPLAVQEHSAETETEKELRKAHPITQLIVKGFHEPRLLLVAFFAAVFAAPIGEEFLYRLLLQGYLEKREAWVRRRLRGLSLPIPRRLFSLVLPAAFFAMLHFRTEAEKLPSAERLYEIFLASSIGYGIFLALASAYLVFFRGATAKDLGIEVRKIPRDLCEGMKYALFLIPPLLLLSGALDVLLKDVGITPDPIPLFFFALGVGFLYFRTHRIVPSITLHMAQNAFAFTATCFLALRGL